MVFVTGAMLVALLTPGPRAPAHAQQGIMITTDYPGVAVEAGETVGFDLMIAAPGDQRVPVAVAEAPDGWSAILRGQGRIVDEVFAGGEEPPPLSLDVDVPADAEPGTYEVVVAAGGGAATLPLSVRVAEGVGGGAVLSAEFASLQGAADDTFSFTLDLANNTGEEASFGLEAAGPEGWQVDARPAGEQQAATVTVAAGETARVTVSADPPDAVDAGSYPIAVRASSGDQTAETELTVDITGNPALTLTTPDERLNAEVQAGGTTRVALLVRNEGSAPLSEVSLSATPPAEWEVDFEPIAIAELPPGEAAEVNATITASGEAVAGDYLVGLEASSAEVSDQIELRTTVETSTAWGIVGVLLIGGVVGGLAWVFRRYGRR